MRELRRRLDSGCREPFAAAAERVFHERRAGMLSEDPTRAAADELGGDGLVHAAVDEHRLGVDTRLVREDFRPDDRLARAGVAPTPELAHRVTDEVKRLREERAASSKSEETIEQYESAMRRLSLNEDDVVDIAIALGTPAKAS